MKKKRKMRSFGLFLVCLLLLFSMNACRFEGRDVNTVTLDTIRSPKNKHLLLEGVWRVSEVRESGERRQKKQAFRKGEKLYLASSMVAIGDYMTRQPQFSGKQINLGDYLRSRLIPLTGDATEDASARVLMIRDGSGFSLDIIQTPNNRVFFIYDTVQYDLVQEKEHVPDEIFRRYIHFTVAKESKHPGQTSKQKKLVLFGLRESKEDGSGQKRDFYSSYLVWSDPDKKRPIVYKTNGLFLMDSENQGRLLTYQSSEVDPKTDQRRGSFFYNLIGEEPSKSNRVLNDRLGRQLTYVGNNIVSFSRRDVRNGGKGPRLYELFHLEEMDQAKALSVLDIAGKSEVTAFRDQILTQRSYSDPQGLIQSREEEIDYRNIGIMRSNTNWSFITSKLWRVGDRYVPALIPINLTTELALFDLPKEPISWSKVTTRFSNAQTASSGPEKDQYLVKTEDELHYFESEENPNSALLSIQLASDSSLVSLRYARGEAAEKIRTAFLTLPLSQAQVLYQEGR